MDSNEIENDLPDLFVEENETVAEETKEEMTDERAQMAGMLLQGIFGLMQQASDGLDNGNREIATAIEKLNEDVNQGIDEWKAKFELETEKKFENKYQAMREELLALMKQEKTLRDKLILEKQHVFGKTDVLGILKTFKEELKMEMFQFLMIPSTVICLMLFPLPTTLFHIFAFFHSWEFEFQHNLFMSLLFLISSFSSVFFPVDPILIFNLMSLDGLETYFRTKKFSLKKKISALFLLLGVLTFMYYQSVPFFQLFSVISGIFRNVPEDLVSNWSMVIPVVFFASLLMNLSWLETSLVTLQVLNLIFMK